MKKKSKHLGILIISLGLIVLVSGLYLNSVRHENEAVEIESPVGIKIVTTSGNPKRVALTFDADMTFGMKKRLLSGKVKSYDNPELIDLLIKENVRATFFLTGMWTETYADEARKIAAEPIFEIGNHSYSHPGFSFPCFTLARVTTAGKKEEITKAQEVIKSITGILPVIWRFPGGCASAKDRQLVESLGLKVIGWDLASSDAFNKNTAQIVKRVLTKATDGADIVFHLGGPNAPETEAALEKIIPGLREKGFEFVKISEL